MIKNVADTALMVAMFRAAETERPDALFRDPLAERLAGEEGRRIVAHLPKGLFFSGWTVVIRTCLIDRFIQEAIASGIDTILNLGAGLDTRPYRMDLPPGLRWIEVDCAEIIELKEEKLAGEKARCRLERVTLDLADSSARQNFFRKVAASSAKTLVLTEGVTPYLRPEDVAGLAEDLLKENVFHYWIVDYFSPESYRYRQRRDVQRTMANAPFRFEPADYFAFFAEHGWHPKEIRYLPEEAARHNRPLPTTFFMKIIFTLGTFFASAERKEAFKKFAGFTLFQRAALRYNPGEKDKEVL